MNPVWAPVVAGVFVHALIAAFVYGRLTQQVKDLAGGLTALAERLTALADISRQHDIDMASVKTAVSHAG